MLHQQVVASSEHQIRLSKGVTAKLVQTLELWNALNEKSHREGGLLGILVWLFWFSISRVANWMG
jgi:hypothetical protein